jgi:hypothetical protein
MFSARLRSLLIASVFALGFLAPPICSFAQAPPAVPAQPDTERRTRYTGVSSVTTFNVGFGGSINHAYTASG